MMDRIAPELTRYYVFDVIYRMVEITPCSLEELEEVFKKPDLLHCHQYFIRLFSGIDRECQVHINKSSGYLMVCRPFSLIAIGIHYPPD